MDSTGGFLHSQEKERDGAPKFESRGVA